MMMFTFCKTNTNKMFMINSIIGKLKLITPFSRVHSQRLTEEPTFETVFKFPYIKYVALFNRLKVYHLIGTSIAIPSCGLLEMFNMVAEHSFLSAAYVGVTGAVVLSMASLPFKNIIGFIYISEDNQHIKISSVNFWGKREDRIISADDWIPLFDMGSKRMDALYFSPQLTDNTHYKLFLKFGNVLNPKKMGEVLE